MCVCVSDTQLCDVESGYIPGEGTTHCTACQHFCVCVRVCVCVCERVMALYLIRP